MTQAFLALAGALAMAMNLVSIATDMDTVRKLTQGLPMLALACWVWPRGDRRVALGLLAGSAGGYLLNQQGGFLFGMIAFAIGHGLYVATFWSWQRTPAPLLLLPIVAYLAVILILMLAGPGPGAGPLTVPVVFYVGIIGAMIWRAAAIAADDTLNGFSRWGGLAGALLFAFSDTLIGVNKFAISLSGVSYPILLTYWGGQLLIAITTVQRGKA
ncbi:lysoplasmalogenase [Rhodoferax sp.]|uniref:lysoplasmalogenase n=1 Tax=Rhodoferax sp. TaxID=50421 RepID=UPI00351D160F